MTPAQAAARINRIADALAKRVKDAATLSAKQGMHIGKEFSQGPYKQWYLTYVDHPYARRHYAGALDRGAGGRHFAFRKWGSFIIANEYIINVQTGKFLAAWKFEPARSNMEGGLLAFAYNDDDKAKFLKKGTRLMVRRPIEEETAKQLRPVAIDNVRQAVRRAMKTK